MCGRAAGAFGIGQLVAIARTEGVIVTSVVGGGPDDIDAFARGRGIGHATRDLRESMARGDVDTVILTTPAQLHADETIACFRAGTHLLCEIPMADPLEAARRVVSVQERTGPVAMVDHVRRFNPSH